MKLQEVSKFGDIPGRGCSATISERVIKRDVQKDDGYADRDEYVMIEITIMCGLLLFVFGVARIQLFYYPIGSAGRTTTGIKRTS